MQHHYGRHGPHAWLHWRMRHVQRLSHEIAHAVTYVVSLPAITTERIIIIIMDTPTSQHTETGNRHTASIGSSSEETYADLKLDARREGIKLANEVVNRYRRTRRPDVFLSKQAIEEASQTKGFDYLQQNIPQVFGDVTHLDEVSRIYTAAFAEGYEEWLLEKCAQASIPDEETVRFLKEVQRQVQADTRLLKVGQIALSSDHLVFLAAIRANEYIRPDLQDLTFPRQLEAFVRQYLILSRQELQEQKGGEDQDDWSHPFSDEKHIPNQHLR